jgi:hypothetical protein
LYSGDTNVIKWPLVSVGGLLYSAGSRIHKPMLVPEMAPISTKIILILRCCHLQLLRSIFPSTRKKKQRHKLHVYITVFSFMCFQIVRSFLR